MMKNEKPKTELEFEKKLKTSTKVYFKSCRAADAAAPEKSHDVQSPPTAITFIYTA